MIEREIERVTLLMYSMYFVVFTLLFQLLAKHSSAALPCNRFVDKCLYTPNNWFVHYTDPDHLPCNYKFAFTVKY